MRRRSFIKTSLAAGAALTVPKLMAGLAAASEVQSHDLPWQREIPLREAAKSVTLESTLNPTNPWPDFGGMPSGNPSMAINNLKMQTTIWGPPERITISLTKNNVWDRRLHAFRPPTIQEITDGAFAPVNENYVGVGDSLRPKDYGWLWKQGGSHDPYREPMQYPFPSLKPVGQIIVGIDALAGATAPRAVQSCANGVVNVRAAKGNAKVSVDYVLGMTSNVYAIRGSFSGIDDPIWLRLYRHQDTSHLLYMEPDNKTYTNPAAEADKAFNSPIDAPTSGTDGRYFWIRQRMPAEKTFPQGFEYVLMGVVSAPEAKLESVEGKTGLGTPHPFPAMLSFPFHGVEQPRIADAPGAAATATIAAGGDAKLDALVTIVTTMDSPDQGASGLPATAVEFTAPNLRSEWQAIGGVLTAKLKDGRLAGTWCQGQTTLPLQLERAIAN